MEAYEEQQLQHAGFRGLGNLEEGVEWTLANELRKWTNGGMKLCGSYPTVADDYARSRLRSSLRGDRRGTERRGEDRSTISLESCSPGISANDPKLLVRRN